MLAHSKEMGGMRKMGGGGGDGSLKDKGKHSLHTVSPPHPTHANPLFFGYDSLTNFSVS